MKKVLLSLVILCSATIVITGCEKKEKEKEKTPEIQERNIIESGIKTLSCNSSDDEDGILVNIDVNISKNYSTNEFIDGTFTVKLHLNENATEEEISMLHTISMCSNDMMGELVRYGVCDTTFEGTTSTSTLLIDKEKINTNSDISLEEIKDSIEKNRNNKKICTIK